MKPLHSMQHRHLNTREYSLAAIDDIITRGNMCDWIEMRDALQQCPALADDVRKVCTHGVQMEEADTMRYAFWLVFLERAPRALAGGDNVLLG